MLLLHCVSLWILAAVVTDLVICQSRHNFNPTIIQDSRLEPRVDGTFGFVYRTEDGISHAAQGDPSGYIQGSYSYKDPTGLKVNFNYFAGAKKKSNSASAPGYRTPESQYADPQSQYRDPEQQYSQEAVQQDYHARKPESYPPQQEYRPRTRPPASYTRSREYQASYEPRYTSSRASSRLNEVYDVDDSSYRG